VEDSPLLISKFCSCINSGSLINIGFNRLLLENRQVLGMTLNCNGQ